MRSGCCAAEHQSQCIWPDEFVLQAGWRALLMPIAWASNQLGLLKSTVAHMSGHAYGLRPAAPTVTAHQRHLQSITCTHLPTHPLLQVRAWICVGLIVVLRLLNLAVPILYKKVGVVGAAGRAWLEAAGVVRSSQQQQRVSACSVPVAQPAWSHGSQQPSSTHQPAACCARSLQVVDEFAYASAVTHPQEGEARTFPFKEASCIASLKSAFSTGS